MRPAHTEEFTDQALQEAERQGLLPDRPNLTKKQVEFMAIYTAGPFLPLKEICRQVGVTPSQVGKWKKKSDHFKKALTTEHHRTQQVANMSRKSVMRGMLEAIEMAKDQRQPGGMISGWKEIGRMCGFYEPERREVVLAVGGQELLDQMELMPKDKLLELASQADAVEGEFEVIDVDA